MARVLVIATSRKTKGGITSVIRAHETGEQWKKYQCRWIQTHRDGNSLIKIWYLFFALIETLFLMPFYDIVHIHLSEMNSTLRKIIFFQIARLFHKKIIVHFHSFSKETSICSKYRPRYQFIFPRADMVIVLSKYWQNAVCEEFCLSDKKVRVLYNPCPTIEKIIKDDEFKTKTILYAGTLNERKGYLDLIQGFAKIANSFPDWKIVFAGNGEIEQGQLLAKELGISTQVVFLGWISGEEKDKYFREARIFCLPSYAEGFPMSVLDAWAYGLPVITTPVGGIPDVAEDGKNMLLFSPGDVVTLSIQLERLIQNITLRNAIAKESVVLANTLFNVNTINHKLEEIYDSLLS